MLGGDASLLCDIKAVFRKWLCKRGQRDILKIVVCHIWMFERRCLVARILKPQLGKSNGQFERYKEWIDWNSKEVLTVAWILLLNGIWIAIPTVHAIQSRGDFSAPITVLGGGSSSFTVSLFWATLFALGGIALGGFLLVSCLVLWLGSLRHLE